MGNKTVGKVVNRQSSNAVIKDIDVKHFKTFEEGIKEFLENRIGMFDIIFYLNINRFYSLQRNS
jgi:hypothetical protein